MEKKITITLKIYYKGMYYYGTPLPHNEENIMLLKETISNAMLGQTVLLGVTNSKGSTIFFNKRMLTRAVMGILLEK